MTRVWSVSMVGAIRPMPPLTGCTMNVNTPSAAHDALSGAVPGEKVCIIGDLGDWRMKVGYSGTAGADSDRGRWPDQSGRHQGRRLHVIVEGFTVLNTPSPEIQINSNNVTLRNTVARNPLSPGSDNLRLTGDDITIAQHARRGQRARRKPQQWRHQS